MACTAFLGLAFYSYRSCEATGGFIWLSKHKPLVPRKTHQYTLPSLQLQASKRTCVASLQHPADLSQASGHLKWQRHLCLGKWTPRNLLLTFFSFSAGQKVLELPDFYATNQNRKIHDFCVNSATAKSGLLLPWVVISLQPQGEVT